MVSHGVARFVFLAALLPMLQIPNVSTQREVKTDIVIHAPAADVWRALTNLPAYTIWNPYIYPASGEVKAGARLEITLHEGKTVTYSPTVTAADPNRELSWGGHFMGMFERTVTFTLTPLDPADPAWTRVEARELFRGLLLLALGGMPDDARRGLDLMTRALRERVELLRPPPPPVKPQP